MRLFKRLYHSLADGALGPTLDERIQAQLHASVHSQLLQSPWLASKIYPTAGADTSFVIAKTSADDTKADDLGLPIPPDQWLEDWEGKDEFLARGRRDADTMKGIVNAHGFFFEAGQKVLEFGCSRGRMLRWLHEQAGACEIWGVDVAAEDITWCQQHLSPPFHFVTTTTAPHLPFEDRSFDFIYAGSVFTHISDLADAWILELRRILRPGGKCYVTVHDNATVELLYQGGYHRLPPWDAMLREFETVTQGKSLSEFRMVVLGRGYPSAEQVFYDLEHLRRHWGRYFRVLSITKGAYGELQTALLLER